MSKLNADALKALQSAEVRKQLASADIEYVGSTPEQCEAFVHEQVAGETDRQGIGGESGLVCCRPDENNSTVPVQTLAMNYPTY